MYPIITEDDCVNYIDSDSIAAEDLSEAQRNFLHNLNNRLSKIEDKIKIEVKQLMALGDAKIADPTNYFDDYDIESHIIFNLAENDPAYKHGARNVLAQLIDHSKASQWLGARYQIADHNNHNALGCNHPMSQEHHCWLYRCLYDQTDFGWSNMLRIGSICLDINIEFLKLISIKPSAYGGQKISD